MDGLNAYGAPGGCSGARYRESRTQQRPVRSSGRRQVCIPFTDGYANISDAGQAFVDFPNNPSGDVQT